MKLLVALFLLLFVTQLSAQTDTAKTILDRKLLWADFTGEVDKSSQFSAMTYWSIVYNYQSKWNSGSDTAFVTFTVAPRLGSSSWVKKNSESDELLRHEQGHYDLAIICAEMLREKFVATTFFKSDYTKKIDSIFQSILQLVKQMELQYDAETNHMLNKDEQKRWNQNIATLLTKVPEMYK